MSRKADPLESIALYSYALIGEVLRASIKVERRGPPGASEKTLADREDNENWDLPSLNEILRGRRRRQME